MACWWEDGVLSWGEDGRGCWGACASWTAADGAQKDATEKNARGVRNTTHTHKNTVTADENKREKAAARLKTKTDRGRLRVLGDVAAEDERNQLRNHGPCRPHTHTHLVLVRPNRRMPPRSASLHACQKGCAGNCRTHCEAETALSVECREAAEAKTQRRRASGAVPDRGAGSADWARWLD
eukprot:881937-Rhodomonas_salina.1